MKNIALGPVWPDGENFNQRKNFLKLPKEKAQ